jgi:hypothetical protein
MDTEYPALRAYLLALGPNYTERAAVLSQLTGTKVSPRVVADLARGRLPRQLRALLTRDALAAILRDIERKSIAV